VHPRCLVRWGYHNFASSNPTNTQLGTTRGASKKEKKKNYFSIAIRGADVDTLVWTQMVEHIAHNDIGHIVNGAPFFGTIVSAARVPPAGSLYVDLSCDVAVSHPSPRYDRYGIQVVVYAVEVPVHLRKKQVISPTGTADVYHALALELNQFAHAGFPTLGVP
jgi:hypothetical protein